MVKRSSKVRNKFLAERKLKKTPRGKEIDHKIPLSEGGSDTLRNMRLIKKSTHKKKTTKEAKRRLKSKK